MLKDMLGLAEQPYSEEDAEWDAFVASHPRGNILQTSNWARLKSRFGWSAYRAWLRKDGQIVAGAQILFRGAAMRLAQVGYIPHGPMVDWQDEEQVTVMLNQVDQAAFSHRAGMVKVEPYLWQHEINSAEWQALCQQHDMVQQSDTIQPPRTMMLDLTKSEDELLAAMKQKTRYNIRLSARKDIIVRTGSREDVPLFNQLMRTTGTRNAFGIHAPEYYRDAYELFAPDNATLLIGEFEGQPLAAAMIFHYAGKAAYLYGASSDVERQRMPMYAVQWQAIQWAKSKGCLTYDMWGVPDEPLETLESTFKERNDDLWGVYRFKRGWGGDIVRTVGNNDRVYNNLVYRLYKRKRNIA